MGFVTTTKAPSQAKMDNKKYDWQVAAIHFFSIQKENRTLYHYEACIGYQGK